MTLLEELRTKASKRQKRICLPEALEDERIITAASALRDEGIALPIVLGAPDELEKAADAVGVSLKGIEVVDMESCDRMADMVGAYRRRRAKENLDESQAREVLKDPVFFGAMLVQIGVADGMVAGAMHATGHVLRAAIKCIGPTDGIETVSSSFLMVMPPGSPMEGRVFTFSDCAFVPQPDPGQLADIAEAAAATHRNLTGEEPLVALLSFSTKGSADTADTQKVVSALEIVTGRNPALRIDGEMQLDTAIVGSVASKKAPDSDIGGRANVLVFPDLDAANIGYKLIQRLAGADAIGPVSQGLAKPVNDLSRGCSSEDVVQVAAITALQA